MQCAQQCYGLCKLFLCCCLSSAMVTKKPHHQRVPMSARELVIIRRLKKVVKLPVAKIAQAVGRHKTTIRKVLKRGCTVKRRGRHAVLTKKDATILINVLRAMVQKVTARYAITLAMVAKRTNV